jgi:hypothetical protein
MLCGHEYDWPGGTIPGAETHNCEPGRILEFEGSEAYAAYVERRRAEDSEAYVSWDEIFAELKQQFPDAFI